MEDIISLLKKCNYAYVDLFYALTLAAVLVWPQAFVFLVTLHGLKPVASEHSPTSARAATEGMPLSEPEGSRRLQAELA